MIVGLRRQLTAVMLVDPTAWVSADFVLKPDTEDLDACAEAEDKACGFEYAWVPIRWAETRVYAGRSQMASRQPRQCRWTVGAADSKRWGGGLTESERAIGEPRRRQMVRQDLSDPKVWSCRCCVTRGRTGRRLADILRFFEGEVRE